MTQAAISIDGFSTATAMMQALRAGEVSAVELLDLHLRRIERYNPASTPSSSRTTTAPAPPQAAAARAQGKDGALLGLHSPSKTPSTSRAPMSAAPRARGRHREQECHQSWPAFGRRTPSSWARQRPAYAGDYQVDNPSSGGPTTLESGGGYPAAAAAAARPWSRLDCSPLEFGSDIGARSASRPPGAASTATAPAPASSGQRPFPGARRSEPTSI